MRAGAAPVCASRSRGGKGGSVPVGVQRSEEEDAGTGTEQNPPPPPQCEGVTSTTEAIDNVLCAAGVFVLAAAHRHACAAALAAAGLRAVDVEDLAEFIWECESDESRARKYLAATVKDPERTAKAVADLGQFRASREAKTKAQRRGPAPTEPWHDFEQVDAATRNRYEEDRFARIAWCRVVADRRDRQLVAEELGFSRQRIDELVARGAELSAPEVRA